MIWHLPYCTDIILCILTPGTPSAHKNESLPSAPLWCKRNWECPCLWQKNWWQKWTIKVTPAPQWLESSRPCVFCHDQPAVWPTAKHVPIMRIIFYFFTYLRIIQLILNLENKWRLVVRLTPWPPNTLTYLRRLGGRWRRSGSFGGE